MYGRIHRATPSSLASRVLRRRFGPHFRLPFMDTRAGPLAHAARLSSSQAVFSPSSSPKSARDKASEIVLAKGQPANLAEQVSELLADWDVSSSKMGITKTYTFSNFTTAWNFMTDVAMRCEMENHHPSWSNAYNKVTMEWTTHKPKGLSEKDVQMAKFCDRAAWVFQTQDDITKEAKGKTRTG